MFSRFFIERPIFAAVIALFTIIAGAAAVVTLPIALYPEITPPTVKVTAFYPGANAQVVSEAVAEPIETQVNGVEGMIYMNSTCSADGSYALTVTFGPDIDLDMASVLVQNRVSVAAPKLPPEVSRLGVTTKKQSTSVVMMLALLSSDDRLGDLFLSNYATMRVRDELSRIEGVGEVGQFGAGDYAMRVWLDPAAMEAHSVTTTDVYNALSEQNVQVAAGKVGARPTPEDTQFEYTVRVRGRLAEVEEFENIIIRQGVNGGFLRVGDVARVEVGTQDYGVIGRYNGQPAAIMAIYQLPGANALDVAAGIREKMEDLKGSFPDGLYYEIGLDTTEFISSSIKEVIITLLIAILLVVITIYIFLQNWRATLIPAIAIPVSLVGTFVIMAALGFTINMITLFGLVLAIWIVVDDAIVVVENTDRNIKEKGLEPRAAAIAAMEEVSGPVIATTLVLLAVFVPTAFMGGMSGGIFRQFALTIAGATVISSINALTLSPALCAVILRRQGSKPGIFFRGFNRMFDVSTRGYVSIVKLAIRKTAISLIAAAGIGWAAFWGLGSLPTGFLPQDDSGYIYASIQLPDSSSLERSYDVAMEVSKGIEQVPGVRASVAVVGFSLLDGAKLSNSATFWVSFDSFEERVGAAGQDLDTILKQVWGVLMQVEDAQALAFVPPPIPGLGTSGGFSLWVQAREGQDPGYLQRMTHAVVGEAAGQSGLARTYSTFRATTPQIFVDIDREAAKSLDIPLTEIFTTLQTYLGSAYVNDFSRFGRNFQVKMQASSEARASEKDVLRLKVRNSQGSMIPIRSIAGVSLTYGPQVLTRFNMYPAALVSGSAAPGFSSGQALDIMEGTADEVLPASMGYSWSGISYQEQIAGSVVGIFALAILFVFLFLAAQYESWTIPFAVIFVVPMSLLGTVLFVAARSMDVNIYTQIGIVLLVGLAAKNAILIVEFAMEERSAGKSLAEAAASAAQLRFRPILMTSLSFVFGTFPLVIASGAGSASRQALGTAVFGGMIAATVMSTLLVPLFYVVVQRLSERVGLTKVSD